MAQLRHERNVFLDRVYEQEVKRNGAISSEEEEEDKLSEDDLPQLPLVKPSVTQSASEVVPTSGNKKRKTVRPISEQVFKVTPVSTDPATGEPIFPISLGLHTFHSLGQVVSDRPAYHTKRYIYPVGFHSSRSYFSTKDPEAMTIYHSRILDGGPVPQFTVTAEDDPDNPLSGATTTAVWSTIMRQAATLRGKEPAGSASGPDFFGLGNATILQLIEALPEAEKCKQYEKKRYEVSQTAIKHTLNTLPNNNNVPTSDAIE